MRVAVYSSSQGVAQRTTLAFAMGIRRCGDEPIMRADADHRAVDADAAVFWGFWTPQQRIAQDYAAARKPWVFLDFGYWGRGKNDAFYKVAVNARHATAYFQAVSHDDSRARQLGLSLAPWRTDGRTVLVLGMSHKASWSCGLGDGGTWENAVIKEIAKHTDREIVYRPKPTWRGSQPLPGARYAIDEPLEKSFADAFATVSHHSNASCDSAIAGIPAFVMDGIAKPMALQDLSKIETPYRPGDREQWLNDAAYCQFSLAELSDGTAWTHLKSEGLIA